MRVARVCLVCAAFGTCWFWRHITALCTTAVGRLLRAQVGSSGWGPFKCLSRVPWPFPRQSQAADTGPSIPKSGPCSLSVRPLAHVGPVQARSLLAHLTEGMTGWKEGLLRRVQSWPVPREVAVQRGEGGLLVPESGSRAGCGVWRKAARTLGTAMWRKGRLFSGV